MREASFCVIENIRREKSPWVTVFRLDFCLKSTTRLLDKLLFQSAEPLHQEHVWHRQCGKPNEDCLHAEL